MSTLKEMANEYKLAAAKIALYINKHKKLGDISEQELNSLKATLRELREASNILSGYYEVPRQYGAYSLVGLTARRTRDDS